RNISSRPGATGDKPKPPRPGVRSAFPREVTSKRSGPQTQGSAALRLRAWPSWPGTRGASRRAVPNRAHGANSPPYTNDLALFPRRRTVQSDPTVLDNRGGGTGMTSQTATLAGRTMAAPALGRGSGHRLAASRFFLSAHRRHRLEPSRLSLRNIIRDQK